MGKTEQNKIIIKILLIKKKKYKLVELKKPKCLLTHLALQQKQFIEKFVKIIKY